MQIDTIHAPAISGLREGTAADERARAAGVAQQFEKLFVQQIVQGMRKSTTIGGEGDLFGGGAGAQTYNDWFDQHLSSHVSNGGRVGIADTLLRDWERLGQIPGAGGAATGKEQLDVRA